MDLDNRIMIGQYDVGFDSGGDGSATLVFLLRDHDGNFTAVGELYGEIAHAVWGMATRLHRLTHVVDAGEGE